MSHPWSFFFVVPVVVYFTKTENKYQRQHETTIDNYVLVFWQTCQNVFLLQFSRFAKLTSLSCPLLSRLSFLIKVPCYPCFLIKSSRSR
jgi:hypothetical protein